MRATLNSAVIMCNMSESKSKHTQSCCRIQWKHEHGMNMHMLSFNDILCLFLIFFADFSFFVGNRNTEKPYAVWQLDCVKKKREQTEAVSLEKEMISPLKLAPPVSVSLPNLPPNLEFRPRWNEKDMELNKLSRP